MLSEVLEALMFCNYDMVYFLRSLTICLTISSKNLCYSLAFYDRTHVIERPIKVCFDTLLDFVIYI